MKKLVYLAAASAALAIPVIASAQHGADDAKGSREAEARQERGNEPGDDRNVVAASTLATPTVSPAATPSATLSVSPVATPNPAAAGITLNQATQIASAQHPGAAIKKVELEVEHGVSEYSFRFTDGARVDVSSATGQVTRTR